MPYSDTITIYTNCRSEGRFFLELFFHTTKKIRIFCIFGSKSQARDHCCRIYLQAELLRLGHGTFNHLRDTAPPTMSGLARLDQPEAGRRRRQHLPPLHRPQQLPRGADRVIGEGFVGAARGPVSGLASSAAGFFALGDSTLAAGLALGEAAFFGLFFGAALGFSSTLRQAVRRRPPPKSSSKIVIRASCLSGTPLRPRPHRFNSLLIVACS